ncbi:hypothetical protein IMCC21906_02122 [Spongiibacter sp. IMCC21906]|uniref:YchJ family protein n=1 Tax=Spongiibacter sp. IMCC21906 TaxID=1620392 RepID=UPI00062DF71B|nr:YchJ family metal-binding protein [Spongiibacter sp. IMCC21906]AKH69790.1 hypothetical protein IMCC21906_02122 [Spongiibacter sp. IMCC21906]
MSACPCCSGLDYEECCCPLLQGIDVAQTPEALMRSRFVAFARKAHGYLISTWHHSRRINEDETTLKSSFAGIRWTRLDIIDAPAYTENRGEVEFVAFYVDEEDKPGQLHERSRFVREKGHWLYLDGDILPPVKLGRNDPCWCGSQNKLKACHPT